EDMGAPERAGSSPTPEGGRTGEWRQRGRERGAVWPISRTWPGAATDRIRRGAGTPGGRAGGSLHDVHGRGGGRELVVADGVGVTEAEPALLIITPALDRAGRHSGASRTLPDGDRRCRSAERKVAEGGRRLVVADAARRV